MPTSCCAACSGGDHSIAACVPLGMQGTRLGLPEWRLGGGMPPAASAMRGVDRQTGGLAKQHGVQL